MALLLELSHEHSWAWGFSAGTVCWPGGCVSTEHGQVFSQREGRFSSARLHKTGFSQASPGPSHSTAHELSSPGVWCWNCPLQSSDQMRTALGIHTRMLVDPQQKKRKNAAESPGSVTQARNCLCLQLEAFSMSRLNSVLRKEGKPASSF